MRLSLKYLHRRLAGRLLLLCLYLTTAAILLMQTKPLFASLFKDIRSVNGMPSDWGGVEKFSGSKSVHKINDGIDVRVAEVKDAQKPMWFNPPDCSVLDFLGAPDPSAPAVYNSSIFCGPEARSKDVFCRMFFSQVGLREDGDCDRTTDDTRVPRFVYYVIFGDYTFKFWNYVSLMASSRHIKPSALYVIGDAHPVGYWWQRVMRDIKGVRFVYRQRPGFIGKRRVQFKHHLSDVVRLQALLLNGGIYLDADMVVLRDLDPLLDYDITMGLIENGTGMGNAFIAAKRNSDFVREWYEKYSDYNNTEFYKNSLHVPRDMWHREPHRLHMESHKLYRPNWFEADLLFKRSDYDWSQNFAVHIWTNGNPVPKSEEEIQTANTTIAQIFRYVLYGDSKPRVAPLPSG